MAIAMTSMAEMCQVMMQKEMSRWPYLLVAGAILGSLVAIALALLVILEVQWIRFWSLRIKQEKARQMLPG